MKTVRVRIAVAVDDNGDFDCAGWREGDDDEIMDKARDNLEADCDRNVIVTFVEAEITIPEAPKGQGTVQGVVG